MYEYFVANLLKSKPENEAQWTPTLNYIFFNFFKFHFIIITIRKIIYCYCK